MAHGTVIEGTGIELQSLLEEHPHEYFRLSPVSKPASITNNKQDEFRPRSVLGKYAFVAGGSDEFAVEKQAK